MARPSPSPRDGTTRATEPHEDNRGNSVDTYPQKGSKQGGISTKALIYYPEENHVPSETACKDFNARMMKHLMKTKMGKNQTFYQSKIVNARDSFLKRQPLLAKGNENS